MVLLKQGFLRRKTHKGKTLKCLSWRNGCTRQITVVLLKQGFLRRKTHKGKTINYTLYLTFVLITMVLLKQVFLRRKRHKGKTRALGKLADHVNYENIG